MWANRGHGLDLINLSTLSLFFLFLFFPRQARLLSLKALFCIFFAAGWHYTLALHALALGPFFLCLSLGESDKHQELLLSSLLA